MIPISLFIFTTSVWTIISSFIICFIISIVVCLGMSGYICVTAHNRINDEESVLPEWSDFGRYILVGLKYFMGYFLFSLPVLLLSILFFCLIGTSMFNVHYLQDTGTNVISFLALTLFGSFSLFVYVLTMVFLPMMMSNFNRDLKILSFVDLKHGFSLVKNNVPNYLILLLLFAAMGVLGHMVCSLLSITLIGIILIPVLYFYVYLVLADLMAQFVKSAKNEIE